jgi:hypothetical protein
MAEAAFGKAGLVGSQQTRSMLRSQRAGGGGPLGVDLAKEVRTGTSNLKGIRSPGLS